MKRGWNWLWLANGSWLLKGLQPILGWTSNPYNKEGMESALVG